MRNGDGQDITGPPAAWNDGDAGALDRLVDLVYPCFQGLRHRQGRPAVGVASRPASLPFIP